MVVVVTVVLLAWLGWGSIRSPEALRAPGALSRYHVDVAQCLSCHEPFHGPSAAKCVACHTEHRGALAQITTNAMVNPHGEFIFRVTGTHSCGACHDMGSDVVARPTLLDNLTVRGLLAEGEGAHHRGRMANCVQCHVGGQLEMEDGEQEK